MLVVMIYTQGPAWQTGKTGTEQPFFREHVGYMHQVFAARQLLMERQSGARPASHRASWAQHWPFNGHRLHVVPAPPPTDQS